ncbi:MAG: hypothetical protein ACRD1U_19175 [Vicinamibacterales bacterium]
MPTRVTGPPFTRSSKPSYPMRSSDRNRTSAEPDPIERPTHCPSCRSSNVQTTSKVINADSYWRCCACGEVWNVSRLRAGMRANQYGRFSR